MYRLRCRAFLHRSLAGLSKLKAGFSPYIVRQASTSPAMHRLLQYSCRLWFHLLAILHLTFFNFIFSFREYDVSFRVLFHEIL